jgi:hypothetical protein
MLAVAGRVASQTTLFAVMEPFPPPTVLVDPPPDPWKSWTRADAFLEIRVRRSLAVAVLLSLLIHIIAILILWFLKERIDAAAGGGAAAPRSLAVRIAPRTPSSAPPPSEAHVETPSEAPVKPQPPSPSKRVMTVMNNSSRSVPVSPQRPLPPVPPVPQQPSQAPMDMMSMVNVARDRRRAQEESAAEENAEAAAAAAEPTADQIAQANIKRNLDKMARAGRGESGIFQIRNMGIRTAQFSFRGWTDDPTNSTLQVIDVDAGPGGNVQLAVVRRMIELIRVHYKGDFNFDSHRLGRVVVQSARIEDTAKLEAFLIQEFFGG